MPPQSDDVGGYLGNSEGVMVIVGTDTVDGMSVAVADADAGIHEDVHEDVADPVDVAVAVDIGESHLVGGVADVF